MDAQVSYAFHSERKLHPEKFKNQLVNQVGIHYLHHLMALQDFDFHRCQDQAILFAVGIYDFVIPVEFGVDWFVLIVLPVQKGYWYSGKQPKLYVVPPMKSIEIMVISSNCRNLVAASLKHVSLDN